MKSMGYRFLHKVSRHMMRRIALHSPHPVRYSYPVFLFHYLNNLLDKVCAECYIHSIMLANHTEKLLRLIDHLSKRGITYEHANQEACMIQLSRERMNEATALLYFLTANACFNGMEQALVGDMLELLNKVEKYPLTYKIEVKP